MNQVLVIEDDDVIRNQILKILKFEDFDTISAENGKKGLKLAIEENPAIILCDVMMPEMDGYEVLRKYRETEKKEWVPFIFLTAKSSREDLRVGMDLGADDYISKPFTAKELISSIHKRLEKQQTQEIASEEKLTELRKQIIYSLPHELYTPLNGILGFTDILLHEISTIDSEEATSMLNEIRSSAKSLHRLFANYLLYAQLEIILSDPKKLEFQRSEKTEDAFEYIRDASRKAALQYDRLDDLVYEDLVEDVREVHIS
ncbi:MAG: two-component system sensor histidine kinase/response regulator, partial [bacterium]